MKKSASVSTEKKRKHRHNKKGVVSWMKTLDITAKEWFDRVNGNSYFSARVVINYDTPSEMVLLLPFQYGYGDHYRYQAYNLIRDEGLLNPELIGSSYDLRDKAGVIIRSRKIENCKKAEVVEWGRD